MPTVQSNYIKRPGFAREVINSPDPRLLLVENEIYKTYGDVVSFMEKGKTLTKFGDNLTVGTSFETVATFQGTTANETFVTTNIIDSIVSDSASDTSQTIVIEGHTTDVSGNLTFVSQEKALTGQTEATLDTPLARATRMYVKASGTFGTDPTALVGNVYVYDNTGGIASGVPNTPAATKCMIVAGETQSNKCATSISSTDYWAISLFKASIGNSGGSASYVTLRIERRDVANGGAWRPLGGDINVIVGQPSPPFIYDNPLIIPTNHDVRVVAKTDSNTAEVTSLLHGLLATVVT